MRYDFAGWRPIPENIVEKLPIDTEPSSHLAVRLERPTGASSDGAVPAVVLYAHGFGSSQSGTKADFFRRSFLAEGIAFCSFDFQGHGESGGEMFDLTLSRNVADLGRVHDHLGSLGYEKVLLMGSSMGGGSCLWYAAQNPERVTAAVHLAPSVEMAAGLLESMGPENAARWEREGRIFFEHELIQCDIGWTMIEDLRAYDRHRLAEIYSTPTLILQGKNDDSVPWRKVLELVVESQFEDIELHLMADADHRMVDRLDHLWRLIRVFLTRHGLVRHGLVAGEEVIEAALELDE